MPNTGLTGKGGFIGGKGCPDQVFGHKEMCEKYPEKGICGICAPEESI